VEIQALVAPTSLPMPRRSAQGVDGGRLNVLVAVLQQRATVKFDGCDVYVSAVGGMKVSEPGADLAVALALVSARAGTTLPADLVACGEVGLGGEVRQVAQTARRLSEASRLGFHRAIVPRSAPAAPVGITAVRVATVAEAIEAARLMP
ncbi:MAG: magnesium chelatase domain-containing protein, partial [Actinomycetota bacterium]